MRAITGITVLLSCALLSACDAVVGQPPVPEAYGAFIRDGRRLVELGADTPEENRRNFGEDAELLIHHNLVDSPLFGPEEIIKITRRLYVRRHVVRVFATRDGPEIATNVTEVGDWERTGEINLVFKPVEGEPDMIIAAPREPLATGTYSAIVGGEPLDFGVGVGRWTAEAESDDNGCIDMFFDVEDRNAEFSWGSWMESFTPGARRIAGNLVLESTSEPCTVLDERLGEWRREARAASGKEELLWAVRLAKGLMQADLDDDIADDVFDAVTAAAEDAVDQGQWSTSIELARAAWELRPEDTLAPRIIERAEAGDENERTAAEEARVAVERARIVPALDHPGPLAGRLFRSGIPFLVDVTTFDQQTGRISGQIEYESRQGFQRKLLEPVIVPFEGELSGESLVLRHPASVEAFFYHGTSYYTPAWRMVLKPGDDDWMYGEVQRLPDDRHVGQVWIDINLERRRDTVETAQSARARRELIAQSKTATQTIGSFRGWAGVSRPRREPPTTVTLTDVGISSTFPEEPRYRRGEELTVFFFDIRDEPRVSEGGMLSGDTVRLNGEFFCFESTDELNRFMRAFNQAFYAWHAKFPGIQ